MILSSLLITLSVGSIVQQAYFKASNPGYQDNFGTVVAISGDTIVVGTPHERSNATGVNGNQADNSAISSGAAYVFVRSGTTWTQQAYLKASNTAQSDFFASSVDVSGDTIVIGTPGEDSTAVGVDGNQSSNGALNSGAVYVFVRSGSVWSQQAYLKASNTDGGDGFGSSVRILGDTLVVGANGEDSQATGIDGNQADDSAEDSGAAYVFVRIGTTWSQQAYLKASNTGGGDEFGYPVALSGETLIVGACAEDSSAAGVNGNQNDNGTSHAGAAYVFVRSGTTWSQEAYLKASNPDPFEFFGFTCSISGDTIVVGAPHENSNATGVNGDQNDDSAFQAGAAYVFVRSGSSWSQEAYLKASNTGSEDSFGASVAVSGDRLFVGANREDSNATGIDGDQNDESSSLAGAVYAFARDGLGWSQTNYMKASLLAPGTGTTFGGSISLSGDTIVVGAQAESGGASGVNGDQTYFGPSSYLSGAAYVFDVDAPLTPYCFPATAGVIACPCGQPANPSGGCANHGPMRTSGALLNATGEASLAADTIVLHTNNHRTASPAGILNVYFTAAGTTNDGVARDAGVRCINTNIRRLYLGSTAAGSLAKPGLGDPSVSARCAALGVAITAGETRHYFNVYRDPQATAPCGSATATTNITNGGAIIWGP